jgi:polyferredoxin
MTTLSMLPETPRPLFRWTFWATILVAAALLTVGQAALAQSFGDAAPFGGEAAFGRGSAADAAIPSSPRAPYFSHDLGLKLALLLGFMAGAAGLAVLGRPLWRRLWLILATAVLGFAMGGFLCPTAAVQNVFLKADTGYLLLFLVPVIAAVLMGRLFCGYVCPFGALQELLHVRRWALRLPDRLMRVLGFARYAVLAYLVARVLVSHTVILDGLSPFKPLFTWGGTPLTIAFSAVVAVLSIVVFRPFCRVLCPYGALLSLVSRLSLLRVQVDATCCRCNLCTSACSAGAVRGGTVDASECLLCGACYGACKRQSLRLTPRWRPGKDGRRSRA